MNFAFLYIGASILFLYGCSGGSGSSTLLSVDAGDTKIITFDENVTINNLNPDRGFYDASFELQQEQKSNIFQSTKNNGYTLAFARINLNKYIKTKTIPDATIKTIEKHLNEAEKLGIKLILRIMYRNTRTENDPSLDTISKHLHQLKPILIKHKNIISVVQAGLIGVWGEWHSFSGDFNQSNPNYIQNRKAVIAKLLEIFPNKYIQIRNPMQKELLYGEYKKYGDTTDKAKTTKQNAYTNNIISHIGHHNDCFLSDLTDSGTYESKNIDFWKQYVIDESKYVPVGGETCNNNQVFTNCRTSLEELKKFNYAFLNDNYNPNVLQSWKNNGCYNEIKNNLGYRLVASSLSIKHSTKSIDINLKIKNKGFSSPYLNQPITFLLKDTNNTYKFLQTNLDLRKFYPNETITLKDKFILKSIKKGSYCLYLSIGSSYSSIRLSNANLWDTNSSSNKLTCGIDIK